MKVKYLDLPAQFNNEEVWNVIKKQLKTGQFILGPEVERFESNLARLCRTSFALGVNSGTDALFLALIALGIGSGDEVITAPNSFVATAGAIITTGATPVFVDVGPDYNIDVEKIETAITSRTRAILPVHLTGKPADMPTITAIACKHGLCVIEDASQAVTASIDDRPVGSFGDVGCFSLHPLKNLNVCGDGGALTTNNKEVYEKVRLLRNHGLRNRDEIEFFGYNSRMDTIQAAVANHLMNSLASTTNKRQGNASIYDRELKKLDDYVALPPRGEGVKQVFHTYVIQAKRREELIKYLAEHGVETRIHYPIPIHLQKPCQKLGYKKGDFPVCEKQAEEILSLPVHQYLTEEQLDYVTGLIKRFYGLS